MRQVTQIIRNLIIAEGNVRRLLCPAVGAGKDRIDLDAKLPEGFGDNPRLLAAFVAQVALGRAVGQVVVVQVFLVLVGFRVAHVYDVTAGLQRFDEFSRRQFRAGGNRGPNGKT